MFVTIRRYSPKNGAINRASVEVLRRQINTEFLPVIQKIPGFTGYYVVNIANRELLTFCLCRTEEALAQSARCAAEYTLRNPLVYELGRPEVTEGEVLTFAEAPAEPTTQPGNAENAAASALALWYMESRGMLQAASDG
jgi:hypothetical protein